MDIQPIKTESDYQRALNQIEHLMSAELNSEQGDKLDVLVTLVEAYEVKQFPLDLPDPIEAIKFQMERLGLSAKHLEPMIGRRNRVYEVLNRRRALTLPMIRKLHAELGIPAEALIKPIQVAA
jgi:HTH-type transcriptional regulator/antitoxin HigA